MNKHTLSSISAIVLTAMSLSALALTPAQEQKTQDDVSLACAPYLNNPSSMQSPQATAALSACYADSSCQNTALLDKLSPENRDNCAGNLARWYWNSNQPRANTAPNAQSESSAEAPPVSESNTASAQSPAPTTLPSTQSAQPAASSNPQPTQPAQTTNTDATKNTNSNNKSNNKPEINWF
jgi:hypothetical protein